MHHFSCGHGNAVHMKLDEFVSGFIIRTHRIFVRMILALSGQVFLNPYTLMSSKLVTQKKARNSVVFYYDPTSENILPYDELITE